MRKMDYLRYNEKRKAKVGSAPTGTRSLVEADGIRDARTLVEVIEMEGRTFRHFRAVTTDQLVTKK
jgi:hypothetical protein